MDPTRPGGRGGSFGGDKWLPVWCCPGRGARRTPEEALREPGAHQRLRQILLVREKWCVEEVPCGNCHQWRDRENEPTRCLGGTPQGNRESAPGSSERSLKAVKHSVLSRTETKHLTETSVHGGGQTTDGHGEVEEWRD